MVDMTRREILGVAAGAALSAGALGGCCAQTEEKAGGVLGGFAMQYENKAFYGDGGVFDDKTAKDAYYAMMDYYRYPITDRLRGEDFWTLDFGLGIFTEVGMAGIFWVNNQEHDYMGHEIFLLPGQMIPEHWHVKTEEARAKVEAWHVRHGWVTLYAEGEPSPGVEERIPESHRSIAVARKEQVVKPGDYGYLANPGERHFMVAGPEGAIVSEYASYHDMAGLRFTHPDVTLG